MKYINVNYSLNSSFNVSSEVFKDIVKYATNYVNGISLSRDVIVNLLPDGKSFVLYVYIKLKPNYKMIEILNFIQKIEYESNLLAKIIPSNIQLIIEEL